MQVRVIQDTVIEVGIQNPYEADSLSTMFQKLSLGDNSPVKFVGFKEQRDTLLEIVDLKRKALETSGEIGSSTFKSKIKIKGILVHGPAGIGKTLMVRDVLKECGLQQSTFLLQPKDMVGDADKNTIIGNLFNSASAVKEGLRVIWLEEVDFIAGIKDKS